MLPFDSVEEDLDLDYDDETPIEPEEREVVRFDRTPLPRRGVMSTPEDHARIHEGLIRHRLAKGRNPDGTRTEKTRVESDEPSVTITQMGYEISWEDLPRSAKGYARRALARGWSAGAGRSTTHVAATLFQADSAEGDADQHSRGDVRWAAEDREHYSLYLWAAEGQIKARLRYEGRPKKMGKPGFDYKLGSAVFADPVTGRVFVTKATEFDDWFDVLVPPDTPRKAKQNSAEALLNGEDWKA